MTKRIFFMDENGCTVKIYLDNEAMVLELKDLMKSLPEDSCIKDYVENCITSYEDLKERYLSSGKRAECGIDLDDNTFSACITPYCSKAVYDYMNSDGCIFAGASSKIQEQTIAGMNKYFF